MMLQLVCSRGLLSHICAVLVSPYCGLVSWFPTFPAMWFDGKGFSDKAGAVFALYSLNVEIPPWFPRVE